MSELVNSDACPHPTLGFAGKVVRLPALKVAHQFCIIETNLTAFSGSQIRIPLCRPELPGAMGEIPPQPDFVSVVAPSWLAFLPLNNATCRTCRNQAYWAFVNRTEKLSGDSGELTRYTFRKGAPGHKGRWATYNNFAPLFAEFDQSRVGSAPVEISVMIHDTVTDASTVPVALWQQLRVRAVATPKSEKVYRMTAPPN